MPTTPCHPTATASSHHATDSAPSPAVTDARQDAGTASVSTSSGARTAIVGATLAMTLGTSGIARAEPVRYTLDPAHTVLALMIEHVGYASTLGQFTELSGGFDYDEAAGSIENLEVTVMTESFDSHHDRRDEHVKSDDFLNVSEYPEMRFTASSSFESGATSGKLEGELTLLGETHPLTLDWTLNKADTYPFGHGRYTLGVSARGVVTRSDYGMTYGVDGGLVGDEVELIIEFEANREG